ncbi:Ig-like domain-containing protein [Aquimarina aquimarini]|uniref:Ig-like domain-containing protein n=1 Tax=Aquimarina aquimarini TaxID=1191734 RepID=UPI001F382DA7|nr:Ig-like domain-containing protein [Aquimarina aquimarini]
MGFGSTTTVLANATNPSADQSVNSLLNNFDISATSSSNIFLAFATSGNEGGSDPIGGLSDAVLIWLGNGINSVSSGTLSTDSGGEIGITSMDFAYKQALGGSTINFTFTAKRDGATVGTLMLTSPAHNSAISIDFTSPSTGSFSNIDEIVITPAVPLFGGFSIDDMVITTAINNTTPTIAIDNSNLSYTEAEAAKQLDNTATVSDADGDADWNGGTLIAQITANAEAADELSISDTDGDGTAITISGTNILANGTDIGDLSTSGGIVTNGTALTITFDADATNTNVQEVLQSIRYRSTSTNPGTSNRTITVTATDTNLGTANDTRTVNVTSAPDVTNISSTNANGSYKTGDVIVIIVTFDEIVTVVGTPQLTLETGTTDRTINYNGTGSGTNSLQFTYTVQTGDISSDLDYVATNSLTAGTSIQNGTGNNASLTLASPGAPNSLGANKALVIDTNAPRISNITRQSPATSPTNADALIFRIVFSESVQNLNSTDFNITGATGASISTTGSGTTYDITLSGGNLAVVNSTITLSFSGGQDITDASGNALTNLTPTGTNNNTFVVDNTAPRISSITRQSPTTSPTNADALVWDVTFNEAVSNVNTADFTVSGTTATITSVTNPSGNVYRVTTSGGDLAGLNATVTLGFAGGQDISDASGNALTNLTPTGTNNNTFVVDNTAPRISSITRQSPATSPTNADALVWDVTFNEAVSNVNTADFTVSGTTATITSVTNPSGNVYRVTTSGGDLAGLNATVTLGFAGGQDISDASGNALTNLTPTGTNNNTFVVDNTAPRISSITRQSPATSPTNADALVWDVTFNEAVSNVNTADFTVSGTTATITSVTNPSGNVYRVTTSGGDLAGLNATVTLDFAGGQDIADASGNPLTNLTPTGTNNNTFVVDNTAPRISSITRQNPATSPTNADALVWDVTFNEAVSNVNTADFTVSGTTATITSVTNPSGNVYRITTSGGDLAGLNATVTLDFAGGQDIADASGNALTNLTPTGTNNNTFVVDNTSPPIIISVNVPANATYITGQNLDFVININKNVTVNTTGGTPQLSLTIGTTTRQAVYLSGSGTSALLFRYTVQAGEQDTDGIAIETLNTNGGTLRDAINNDLNTTLNSIGSTTAVLVDTVAPTATITMSDTNIITGETVIVTFTFSEAVTGFTNTDITTTPNGTLSAVSSTDGGITYTATYTPNTSVEDATNVITIDNTGITDTTSNPGTGTTDSPNFTIDTNAPTATIVMDETMLSTGQTATVTFTFSEIVTGFDNTDLTIPNGTLSDVSSTDGGITYTATYTPNTELDDATNVITINNIGITDVAGNTGIGTTDSSNFVIETETPIATTTLTFDKGFSPNGDGINDTWVIEGIENFANHMIQVFNRSGKKVFEAVDYQNNWNGESNGRSTFGNDTLPAGAYYYVIETGNPEIPPFNGWIYINY